MIVGMTSDLPDPGPDEGVTIDVETIGGTVVLRVAGELDMLTTPEFQDALMATLAGSPPVIVVDMSGVTFMSSTAMAVMVQVHRDAAGQADIRVVAAGRQIVRPLQQVGLDDYLALYPTLAEALAT